MVDANKLISDAQTELNRGNDSVALDYYNQALLQHPDELSLQIACGNLCVKLARYEEAAGHFRRILLSNKSPEVRNALCYTLQSLGNSADRDGNYTLAEVCFEEALQHQPNNAAYWYNLGNAQRELGKNESAVTSFQHAIQADPNDADAYNNLGNVQRELGHLDLAIENYKEALRINPNLHHALAHLIHQKQHICDWRDQGDGDLNQQIQTVRNWVKTKPEAQISPFAFLAMPTTTAEEQKTCASQYVEQNYQHLLTTRDALSFKKNNQDNRKINIGYLSADFRQHPLAFLITDMIEAHDREHFTVTAYSYGVNDQSPTRKRLINAFDNFVEIQSLNDIEAATKINQDNIDILIDLTGFTQSSRTGIVALSPAKMHVNWLGYPGTMGAFTQGGKEMPLFEYILADTTIAPHQKQLSEKILRLPCYQPNGKRIDGPTSQKHEHSLPDDSFVFCCFNQTFKITPDIFAVWMQLLEQMPKSVLWLLDCNQWAKENLQQEAQAAGIDQARLIFAPRTTSETHMERQQHADVFLDTMPYNAHTTASDAIWAGIPIVTCHGDTFASNVSASLLKQIGLPELICDSLTSYEEKALSLANNENLLMQIKVKVRQARESSDLFNAEKFARLLEEQLLVAIKTYHQDTSLGG